MRKSICASVRPLLPAFVTHELDAALTTLVREHLRNCAECAAEASEILQAVNVLRSADSAKTESTPTLARDRRKRTLWLMEHPLAGWFFLHRHITGIICAVVVMTVVFLLLLTIRYPDIFKFKRYEVIIQTSYPAEAVLPDLDPPPSTPIVPDFDDIAPLDLDDVKFEPEL